MCRAFIDNWRRQAFIEAQQATLKEFARQADQLSERIKQQPLGYPCSLMIWDKNGYHQCKGAPIFDRYNLPDNLKQPKFCTCYYVGHTATDDMLTDDVTEIEEKTPFYCPKKYTWKQMESKIAPAIKRALELRRKREALTQ